MRFVFRLGWLVALFAAALCARGQNTVPTLNQPIPNQSIGPDATAATVDLRSYFTVPGVSGQLAQFDTVLGRFNVELLANAAPRHVANFLSYAQSGAYVNSFFHRSASLDQTTAVSIVQGGGYRSNGGSDVATIAKSNSVPLEYNLPNARGTLAAARTSDVNSATSEWYFNVRDDSTILNQSNGGGYTVFGRVVGSGMSVVDAIAALPRVNAGGAFTDLPVRDFSGGNVVAANLVIVNSISAISLYPGGGPSLLQFSVQNSAPSVVGATLTGSTLTLTALASGSASITVRAADINGNAATSTFSVSVAAVAPVFTLEPGAQQITPGSTVVFRAAASGAPSYRWRKDGGDIPGATGAMLVLFGATAQDAGAYSVQASNSAGNVVSRAVNLTLSTNPDFGRLSNLSIFTDITASSPLFTIGTYVGGTGTVGSKPLIIRAAGPALAQLSVGGPLPDPKLEVFGTATASNDNWETGGATTLAAAFASVAAFVFPPGSKDAAIYNPSLAQGAYTVQVNSAVGGGTGNVIAEIYDATPNANFTPTTPRVINVSVRKQIAAGGTLTAGFYVNGQTPRTVLIRAIGPGLGATFNLTGFMPDPQLTLFNSAQARIAENDNWGGDSQITAAGNRVGAFAIADGASRDAMLLITLAPGGYTAQATGVGGSSGDTIVEVYEVP